MNTLVIFDRHLSETQGGWPDSVNRLVLPFERRLKARQRACLESGREIGIQLARGTVLRDGDGLESSTGEIVQVVAAGEAVSTATSDDAVLLARAAYHLGNRHVHLQVGQGWLRYLHDHVLDHMVESLGLSVNQDILPFEPEAGAYEHGHEHRH
ncbi:MAG: urease accessory protein UreE [Gammaproteobacteria bacterium]|jgi:urease accessory protein